MPAAEAVSMAGSSMRLVRLKAQGPGLNRGPDRPMQKKILERKFAKKGPKFLENGEK